MQDALVIRGMKHSQFWKTVAAIGLPLGVIATIILAISYINDQQNIRLAANEPQEYVARDAVLRVIASGALPTGYSAAIPIESDPAAYLVFFDATGTAVAGTGLLHNAPPVLPPGVLAAAKKNGINRITWQPEKGVRQALVILPAGEGFVMSGRSLTYAEEQEKALMQRALMGWLGTMVAVIIVSIISAWLLRRKAN
ncbi:MAG: hypothetical protein JWL82_322 [Parcubacteria group bacterium]|nr:hypothetical protein [Parcubacteria group bacterium]